MKRLLFVALILITGCTSVYHIGANVHSDGTALYRPVPKHVSSEMIPFEETCVKAVLSSDVQVIKAVADLTLREKLAIQPLRQQLDSVRLTFHLNGSFARRKLHNTRYWLDEMISKDPYKIYDFIACEYELRGDRTVRLLLLIDKKSDSFRLWGFSVYSCDSRSSKTEITYTSKDIKKWWTFGYPM
jgi:hypothetical protein